MLSGAVIVGPNDTLVLTVDPDLGEDVLVDKDKLIAALEKAGINRDRVVVTIGFNAQVIHQGDSIAVQANPQLCDTPTIVENKE